MKYFNPFSKTVLFVLLMAFIAISCKNDDDDVTTEDNNEIVGVWILTDVSPETSGTTIALLDQIKASISCLYSLKFTFTSDNKVALSDCDLAVTLLGAYLNIASTTTWKVESGNLILTNGSTTNTFPLVQNTNEMKITVNTNTSGSGAAVNAVMTLKRQ